MVLATLLGGAAAAMTFLPRPSVSSGDPVDPDNPFSSRFTVRNGNIPLTNLKIEISEDVFAANGDDIKGNTCVPPEWQHDYFAMDESFDITPADVFRIGHRFSAGKPMIQFGGGGPIVRADLTVIVDYDPWFIPVHRSKKFRFEAHRQTNGQFYWYSVPAN